MEFDVSFLLSNLVPPLLYPLGLGCLLVAAAALRERRRPGLRALLLGALGVLWLSGTWIVSEPLGRSLEWRYLPVAEPPSADRIVVLGGVTEPVITPRQSVELGSEANRLLQAARLWRAGKAPIVVLCGGHVPGSDGKRPESADMADVLELLGVPASAILEEDRSRNTYENAVEARRLLEPAGVNRILLVTSALHMPRAVASFRRQGFEVTPAPTDFRIVAEETHTRAEFIFRLLRSVLPDAETLAYTTRALHEYLGIAIYKVEGRID